MEFRNFKRELPAILEKGQSIVRNFQAEWRKHIIREIDNALPLGKVEPEDDLTIFALYRIMQRFYFERGSEGLEDILKLWPNLRRKHEDEREKQEQAH